MSKNLILNTALKLATKTRYDRVTRQDIATAAHVAAGSVNYYFGDMASLRTELLKHAIENGRWDIVAPALMDKHAATLGLDADQRALAMAAAFA